ncbi:transposase [Bradyrhizobium sp. Pha-3]|uniref:transposase n=1 Tax=Bradyrhizobium sp. Pha-3 TaxID=208375 RepID=UPI0035D3E446
MGRGQWDADALRDVAREYALERKVMRMRSIIDETVFLKQGKALCGAARQYTGSAGKVTNCQIGVFASCVAAWPCLHRSGALHLSKEWTDEPARLKAAHAMWALRRSPRSRVE